MNKKHLLILMIWLPLFSLGQGSFRIAGKVTDASTKQPLQGASVFCQNTTIGTVTSEEGAFSLALTNGGYDLVISFSGFETQAFHINNTTPDITSIAIELTPKRKSLETIAIVATNSKNGWRNMENFLQITFWAKLPMLSNVLLQTRKYCIFL